MCESKTKIHSVANLFEGLATFIALYVVVGFFFQLRPLEIVVLFQVIFHITNCKNSKVT